MVVKLLDHYSEFRHAFHTCKCGWSGTDAMMRSGNGTGLGIDKHCPSFGELYDFARFSELVGDEVDDD